MHTGRRSFLGTIVALPALACFLAESRSQAPQPQNPHMPRRPDPQPETREPGEPPKPPKIDPQQLLLQNQKEIKEDAEKLFKLVTELRKEVNSTDSAKMLSLVLIHKADEIEKLAKQIKNLARG